MVHGKSIAIAVFSSLFAIGLYLYFIENSHLLGSYLMFLGFWFAWFIIYFARVAFYIKHKASLNEAYFVIGALLTPFFVLFALSSYAFNLKSDILFIIDFTGNIEQGFFISLNTSVNFFLFSIIYFLAGTILIYFCFSRYLKLRFKPQNDGNDAEKMGMVILFFFGSLYLAIGYYLRELLFTFFGAFYLIWFIISIFTRKEKIIQTSNRSAPSQSSSRRSRPRRSNSDSDFDFDDVDFDL